MKRKEKKKNNQSICFDQQHLVSIPQILKIIIHQHQLFMNL